MTIPLLLNHDSTKPIGYWDCNGVGVFDDAQRITRDQLFNIFSGGGIKVLEWRIDGDVHYVKSFEILEFSLSDELPRGRYPHWSCRTHGDFDARFAVGCPECVRLMRSELRTLRAGGEVNVAPIAKLIVRDGKIVRGTLYAPGLPDGEHEVFPVPLHPSGQLKT